MSGGVGLLHHVEGQDAEPDAAHARALEDAVVHLALTAVGDDGVGGAAKSIEDGEQIGGKAGDGGAQALAGAAGEARGHIAGEDAVAALPGEGEGVPPARGEQGLEVLRREQGPVLEHLGQAALD